MQLSPSALSILTDCPRCFYLDRRLKTKRPRGIFPSLPGGMDGVLKTWSDTRRQDGILEALAKNHPNLALFADGEVLKKWRNWRTGPKFSDAKGNVLAGAVDDVLVDGDVLVPFDYKTKGSETDDEAVIKYYQAQLDNYALMMQSEGYEVANYGILMSIYPVAVKTCGHAGEICFDFKYQLFKVEISTQRAEATFKRAIEMLERNVVPAAGEECEYCKTFYARQQTEVALRKK